jgi:hypothetical protein
MKKRYCMFTEDGNSACEQLVLNMKKHIDGPMFMDEKQFNNLLDLEVRSVIRGGHEEITDTEPRWIIEKELTMMLQARGYGYEAEI